MCEGPLVISETDSTLVRRAGFEIHEGLWSLETLVFCCDRTSSTYRESTQPQAAPKYLSPRVKLFIFSRFFQGFLFLPLPLGFTADACSSERIYQM